MRKLTLACGLLGLTGVGLGAFGAHALKATLLARGSAGTWETAVHYHLLHTVALLGVLAWSERIDEGMRRGLCRSGWCWVAGVGLFSGSLYALALGGPTLLGPVTPLGGLALLLGWAGIVLVGWRRPAPVEKN